MINLTSSHVQVLEIPTYKMDSQKKKDDEMIHMPFLHENITIEIPLHILQSLKPGQLVFPDPELHPYLYVVRTETGSHLFF